MSAPESPSDASSVASSPEPNHPSPTRRTPQRERSRSPRRRSPSPPRRQRRRPPPTRRRSPPPSRRRSPPPPRRRTPPPASRQQTPPSREWCPNFAHAEIVRFGRPTPEGFRFDVTPQGSTLLFDNRGTLLLQRPNGRALPLQEYTSVHFTVAPVLATNESGPLVNVLISTDAQQTVCYYTCTTFNRCLSTCSHDGHRCAALSPVFCLPYAY